MSLAQRLKQTREQARISQRELARRSGLSQQLISKLENGLVESTTEVFRLAETLGVNARWLATGQGKEKDVEDGAEEGPAVTGFAPLISWVAAGMWQDVADPYPPGAGEEMVPVTCRVGPLAFALRVQGDSMEPVFPDGCVIIVDPSAEPRQGSYVVVRLDEAEQATFKQLVIDGGARYLKPLNPRYPLMEIRQSASLCGVVRQMVMDFE